VLGTPVPMSVGSLAVRGVVGPYFIGHGTQKLFGWFEGHGLEGTAAFFEQIGLRPGRRHAIAAGAAEAGGGLLLTLGALTPLATTLLSSTMVTAARRVHAANGPWIDKQGYEYYVTLIAALTALADRGPGRPSVDATAFPRLKGAGWALASLGAAVAGSYLVDRFAAPAPGAEAQAVPVADATVPIDDGQRFTRPQAPAPR